MWFILPIYAIFFTINSEARTTTHFSSSLHALPSVDFDTKKIDVAGQLITRSCPIIDGIPVEGADGVFIEHTDQFFFSKLTMPMVGFKLTAAEAMEEALPYHGRTGLKDPYVERTDGLYQPLWLMHFGELRPAYKIRLPAISIFDLKDIYIDANNGDVLRMEDAAQFVSAPSNLFVYSPGSSVADEGELKRVILNELVDLEDNGFLHGKYMQIRTCCKYFTCPEKGPCNDFTKRCALKSHRGVRQTRELIDLPTSTLGLDPMMDLPPTLSVDTVRCTYLPFARASYKSSGSKILGFFDQPIDRPGIESEMDRFSEIQAYFSMMSFFEHIRFLLKDQTWCLRKHAMSCNADGSPVVDRDGYPTNPYRVFVNQLIPDMKIDGPRSSDADNMLSQILAGKGSRDNPIKLDQFARFGNAAFVPALSTLKKGTPRADEILSDLIKPFDHNVFFQGERDFAYDGDVVFHEFMHSITTSMINKINSLGIDRWGIHSEPGGLNEAWADYFAASFTNDSAIGEYASVRGGYGEVSLRNIENQASCPSDVIGEAHNDGQIWSGALWQMRTTIKRNFGEEVVIEFDRAVLATLAQATPTEDFKSQGQKLIANIKRRDILGHAVADLAYRVLRERGLIDCFRAHTLSVADNKNDLTKKPKRQLFVPSKIQIGLKNYAPAPLQLEIGIPAGAKGLTISWRQFIGGTGAMLGQESTPESTKNARPLGMLLSFDSPIVWNFKGRPPQALPSRLGERIEEYLEPSYKNGWWKKYIPLKLERCEQKTMFISLVSNDHKYVLEDISVDFDLDDGADLSGCEFKGSLHSRYEAHSLSGCTTGDSDNNPILLMLLMLWFYCLGQVKKLTRQRVEARRHPMA